MTRQRTDGTWTSATPEWDARWYWPAGTRVAVPTTTGPATGVVLKQNATTVRIRFDDPASQATHGPRLVPMRLLVRL